jgi:hypothetical protein
MQQDANQTIHGVNAVTIDDTDDQVTPTQHNAGDQFGQRSRSCLTDHSQYIGMFQSSH